MRARLLTCWCLVSGLCLSASGQYSLEWFKVAGGGGSSTNGPYALSGTIGQADASGTLNGGVKKNMGQSGTFECAAFYGFLFWGPGRTRCECGRVRGRLLARGRFRLAMWRWLCRIQAMTVRE